MDKKSRDAALAGIKDPAVREHYRAQLEMSEELEGELEAGGIFDIPGDPRPVQMPVDLAEFPARPRDRLYVRSESDLRRGRRGAFLWGVSVTLLAAAFVAWLLGWLK
jgi:hypothetical protein